MCLVIIEDAQTISRISDSTIKEDDVSQSFDVPSDGGHHWLRVNIRDRENHLLMVGNPIYW